MLHRKIPVNDGFGVLNVTTSTKDKKEYKEHRKPSKKFEDVELQALLNGDDSQTQKQAVSNRLRETGKIQKTVK